MFWTNARAPFILARDVQAFVKANAWVKATELWKARGGNKLAHNVDALASIVAAGLAPAEKVVRGASAVAVPPLFPEGDSSEDESGDEFENPGPAASSPAPTAAVEAQATPATAIRPVVVPAAVPAVV